MEKSNPNRKLWDAVSQTNPQYTKKQTFGAKLTAIDPTYQAREATELFGPYGVGWGVSSLHYDLVEVGGEMQMIMQGTFFYEWDGETRHLPIVVDLPFKPNQDTAKKCQTMLVSKALSKLGFNADIRLGKFEDDAYAAAAAYIGRSEEAAELEIVLARQQEEAARSAIRAIRSKVKDNASMLEMSNRLQVALDAGKLSSEGYSEAMVELQKAAEKFAK